MIRAKLAVFGGGLLHSSAGETSGPAQVNCFGISAPEAKAELFTVNGIEAPSPANRFWACASAKPTKDATRIDKAACVRLALIRQALAAQLFGIRLRLRDDNSRTVPKRGTFLRMEAADALLVTGIGSIVREVQCAGLSSDLALIWRAIRRNRRRILLAAVISLRDVVDALDLQSDELSSYLDPDSGEIITFNQEEARIAERGDWDGAPDWMCEVLPKIKRALEDRMLPLPDRVHIDEWRMMQDFAEQYEDCHCRAVLSEAVHGSGAFRLFRRTIAQMGIEEQWRRYRDKAMERIAREWLEENNLKYR